MKEIYIPKLGSFLPHEQGRIQLGELPLSAETGPWRAIGAGDKPHPYHVLGNTQARKEMIPVRLYGTGERPSPTEVVAVESVEFNPAQFVASGATETVDFQSLTIS